MITTLQGKAKKWKFDTTDPLGNGGNSVVYRASQEDDATKFVALKLFTDSSVSEKKLVRFRQEITTMVSLHGTSGCSELLDYGIDGERPFYVMPYYSGGDLHKKFIKYPEVPREVNSALRLFVDITEIVSRLHSEPRVLAVRDLKPQNILLTANGLPIVCDFGLSLWADTPDEDRLTTLKGVGSAGYRPPEWATSYPESKQIQGDIWSLGRTLWAILAARVPPANYESLGTTEWHLKNFLQDSHVAQAIQGIVNQCTRIKPDERPTATVLLQSTQEVLKYCASLNGPAQRGNLDNQLAALAILLPGNAVIATAEQLKAELDSKYNEIEDCRDILISKLREFEPKLVKSIPPAVGTFVIGGRERFRDSHSSWQSNASIRFIPSSALQDTGLAREIRYVFRFGLNSNNDFFWTEQAQVDGHDSDRPLINPKSLSALAAQKCGQIESILSEDLIPEIERALHLKPPVGFASWFINAADSGSVKFDYSNNDGKFTIGSSNWKFVTHWSKASDKRIHTSRPNIQQNGVAIATGISDIRDIKNAASFDFSSHTRTPMIGQVVIFRNQDGYYSAAKVNIIWDNTRGSATDLLEFDFLILTDKGTDFSKTK